MTQKFTGNGRPITASLAFRCLMVALLGLFLVTVTNRGVAQDINASLSGTVTDQSQAAIPAAKLTITNVASGVSTNTMSDGSGHYALNGLLPGNYDLAVTATGFQTRTQKGIELAVGQVAREDIQLSVGQTSETVTVTADASLINYENQTLEGGISPEVLEDFPLVVGGAPRTSISVVAMMPGVITGGGNNPYNARINGGTVTGDEAIVDGVTASEGFMSQSGMVALQTDFGMSPDITSEVHAMTANYPAQYGNSTSGELIIETKSGGEHFHGGGFDYVRNNMFNAIQYGNSVRPPDKENDFGAFIGGPWYVPGFHGANSFFKGYFYFTWEGFQDHGGAVSSLDSIASANDRTGNFINWANQIYYPADPVKYGADAATPIDYGGALNQVNPAYEDSIAKAWLAALPTPTSNGETNNYYIPKSGQGSLTNSENVYFARADLDIGSKDHIYYTYWWQYAGVNDQSDLPLALTNAGPANPENAPIQRFNWQHTFSNALNNHLSLGYLNRNEGYFQLDGNSTLPKVTGVASTEDMPTFSFSNYTQLGTSNPANSAKNVTTRGTYGLADLVTYVHGRHTFTAGYEWTLAGTSIHHGSNEGGSFYFDPAETNNATIANNLGDDMASFYMGAVGSASTNYVNVLASYPRQYTNAVDFGDSWRVASRLVLNLSLRWDYATPFSDKFDNLTFFDPVGGNPGAVTAAGVELPGRLAYAGTKWGSNSYGAPYPEIPFKAGWAPRVGFAYTLNEKTVVRSGYGMYYGRAFYPGWGGGMSQDGFNDSLSLNETPVGGFQDPALYIQNGISAAQTGSTAEVISSSYDNGQRQPSYRPLDGNHRPYSQMWNVTLERQLPGDFFMTVSYVGTKGTHLPSDISPLNALNPTDPTVQALYAPGVGSSPALNDVFGVNQATLDGVSQPYVGWAGQMSNCAPTVQQALEQYPMYCGVMQGEPEYHATSIYNSFQVQVQHHLSHNIFLLAALTTSKMYSDGTYSTQGGAGDGGSGNVGNFSPYETKPRGWSLVPDNTPVTGQISAVYSLPFGRGQKWANDNAVADEIIGGWRVTPLFHYDYGQPFSFGSGVCETAAEGGDLREQCIPGIVPGGQVELHGRESYNPKSNVPYFNVNAFETVAGFNQMGYTGTGNAVTNVYGPNYRDLDISFAKDFAITEKAKFKFSANFFNALNNHYFIPSGVGSTFNTDISKVNLSYGSNFGDWNGGITSPRTIQFSGRLEF